MNDGVGLEKGNPEEFVALTQESPALLQSGALRASSSEENRGSIVNIASRPLYRSGGTSGYVASKGAFLP